MKNILAHKAQKKSKEHRRVGIFSTYLASSALFIFSAFSSNIAKSEEVEAIYFRPKEIKKGCGLKKEDNLQDVQYIYIPSTNQLYGQYSFSKLSPEEMKTKRTEKKDDKKKRKKKGKDKDGLQENKITDTSETESPERDAYQTGFWTVMNDGPNPKHEKRQYAMIYGDFINNRITAYTYDGSQIKDSYEHEKYIGTFEKPFHIYDNGNVRTVAYVIDLNGIKKAYTNKDWVGMGVGADGAGTWFHNSFGTAFTYGDKQSPLLSATNTKESGGSFDHSKSKSKSKEKKEGSVNSLEMFKKFKAFTDKGIEVEAETPDDQPMPKAGERYVTAQAYSKGAKVKAYKEGSSFESGAIDEASKSTVPSGQQYKVTKEGLDSASGTENSTHENHEAKGGGSAGNKESSAKSETTYSLTSQDGSASGATIVAPKGGRTLKSGTTIKVPEGGVKAGQSVELTGEEFSVGTKLYAPSETELKGGATFRVNRETEGSESGGSAERSGNSVKYTLKTESGAPSDATITAPKSGVSLKLGTRITVPEGGVKAGQSVELTGEEFSVGTKLYAPSETELKGGSTFRVDREMEGNESGGSGELSGNSVKYTLKTEAGAPSDATVTAPKSNASLKSGTRITVPEGGVKAGHSAALSGEEFSVGTKIFADSSQELTAGTVLIIDKEAGDSSSADVAGSYELVTAEGASTGATLTLHKGGKALSNGTKVLVPQSGVEAGQTAEVSGEEFTTGATIKAGFDKALTGGTTLYVGKEAVGGGKVRILLDGAPRNVYLEFNKGSKLPSAGTMIKVPDSGLKPNEAVPVSGEGIPEGSTLIYIPESGGGALIIVAPVKGDELPKGAIIIIPDAGTGAPSSNGSSSGASGTKRVSGGDGLTGDHPSDIPLPDSDKSVPMSGGQALLKYKYSEQGPWIDTNTEKADPTQLIMMDLTNPSAPTLGEMSAFADPPPVDNSTTEKNSKQGFNKGGMATEAPLPDSVQLSDPIGSNQTNTPDTNPLPHTPIGESKPRGNPAKDPDKVWSWCSLQEKIAANPKLGPMAVQGIGIKGPKDGFVDVNTLNLNCLSSFSVEIMAAQEVDGIAVETDAERVELHESGRKDGRKIFKMSNSDSESKQLFHYGKNDFSIFVKIDGEEVEVEHVVDIPSP